MYLEKYYLEGQTAFITGGGHGNGLATAEAMLRQGQCRYFGHRRGNSSVWSRVSYTEGVFGTDPKTGRHGLSRRRVGGQISNERHGSIDILVANAEIAWPDTAAEDIPDDVWRRLIDVDLNGVYWCCREFSKYMLQRQHGSRTTLGSISGVISNKPQRQTHYNAAKAAVPPYKVISRRVGGARSPS